MSNLLLIDVGNTSATWTWSKKGVIGTPKTCLHGDIPEFIKYAALRGRSFHFETVLSSVVPLITDKLTSGFKRAGLQIWRAGGNLPVKLTHKYNNINKLGTDRLLNVYGALHFYRPPLLILDFGTALTADIVSAKGVFEGGMIIPGPELSFQALIEKAALLPKKVRLPRKARGFVGQSTRECLNSGILEGYGALTDGLIERFKTRYGKKLKVVATGGFASQLQTYANAPFICDSLLCFRALQLLYLKSRPQ